MYLVLIILLYQLIQHCFGRVLKWRRPTFNYFWLKNCGLLLSSILVVDLLVVVSFLQHRWLYVRGVVFNEWDVLDLLSTPTVSQLPPLCWWFYFHFLLPFKRWLPIICELNCWHAWYKSNIKPTNCAWCVYRLESQYGSNTVSTPWRNGICLPTLSHIIVVLLAGRRGFFVTKQHKIPYAFSL